jgi:hypothetical protein
VALASSRPLDADGVAVVREATALDAGVPMGGRMTALMRKAADVREFGGRYRATRKQRMWQTKRYTGHVNCFRPMLSYETRASGAWG